MFGTIFNASDVSFWPVHKVLDQNKNYFLLLDFTFWNHVQNNLDRSKNFLDLQKDKASHTAWISIWMTKHQILFILGWYKFLVCLETISRNCLSFGHSDWHPSSVIKVINSYGYLLHRAGIFKAHRLFFLPNFPGPTFIPCPTFILEARVDRKPITYLPCVMLVRELFKKLWFKMSMCKSLYMMELFINA